MWPTISASEETQYLINIDLVPPENLRDLASKRGLSAYYRLPCLMMIDLEELAKGRFKRVRKRPVPDIVK